MAQYRILLDSNAYLRLANSFHPLLHESYGEQSYVLYVIPEFQKEFDKNPRLKNKFGWVNQPEYKENRKRRIRITRSQKEQIHLTYSYIWDHNISQGLGASRIDVRTLAYGAVLGVPVITDDSDMTELGKVFGIEVRGLLDLLKLMFDTNRIDFHEIETLLDYLQYNKDLPYPSFRKDVIKVFKEF